MSACYQARRQLRPFVMRSSDHVSFEHADDYCHDHHEFQISPIELLCVFNKTSTDKQTPCILSNIQLYLATPDPVPYQSPLPHLQRATCFGTSPFLDFDILALLENLKSPTSHIHHPRHYCEDTNRHPSRKDGVFQSKTIECC